MDHLPVSVFRAGCVLLFICIDCGSACLKFFPTVYGIFRCIVFMQCCMQDISGNRLKQVFVVVHVGLMLSRC